MAVIPLNTKRLGTIAMVQSFAACIGLYGQNTGEPDLSGFSLKQSTHVEINTASRRAREFFATPAAAYVITQEDIERSGATSVPELLPRSGQSEAAA